MLSAAEHGLTTIPAAVFVGYPQLIGSVLDIPDEKAVIIGIGVGYPDPSAKSTTFDPAENPYLGSHVAESHRPQITKRGASYHGQENRNFERKSA